jgi:hypothetical protein
MRRDQRRVYFYDLASYSRAKTPQMPTLAELFEVWHARWRAGRTQYLRDNGTRVFNIRDITFDDDYITILFTVIDKNMPDAAYGDLDTGDMTGFQRANGKEIRLARI